MLYDKMHSPWRQFIMMKFIEALVFFFIPHPLNAALRRLLGQKVENGAKIHIFSFILTHNLFIGKGASIAPFCIIQAYEIKIGDYAQIAPAVIIRAQLIKGACFHIGKHSRVFPFCWIEPGEGVYIGDQVGVGAYSLIFTHGAWSDFLHNGPVKHGSVTIEDHVWLPWRVFVLPGVTIGRRSIVGANSTVTASIPAHTLAAGSPAKIMKSGINTEMSPDEFIKRVEIIFSGYKKYCFRLDSNPPKVSSENACFYRSHLGEKPSATAAINIDMSNYTYQVANSFDPSIFLLFLITYGIRLERKF
jgi:acetyltransferase-like isoleucine patch superfamily enzyme